MLSGGHAQTVTTPPVVSQTLQVPPAHPSAFEDALARRQMHVYAHILYVGER